jgi:hypothetical protein
MDTRVFDPDGDPALLRRKGSNVEKIEQGLLELDFCLANGRPVFRLKRESGTWESPAMTLGHDKPLYELPLIAASYRERADLFEKAK